MQCPSCYEIFEVAVPPPDEQPCEVDCECEVCRHPMVIRFAGNEAEARSLAGRGGGATPGLPFPVL